MYLHIGNGKMIKMKDIVGIFDSEKRGGLFSASGEIPKSIVLECGEKGENVYFSQLSPKTLCQRAEKY